MAFKTFAQLYTDALTQCDELSGSGSATAKSIVKAGINESYSEVASVRDWGTLENEGTVTTAQGTMEYTPVTSSPTVCRVRRIVSVLDETGSRYLDETKREDFERSYPYVDPSDPTRQGSPVMWFQGGYTSGRDIRISLYPVPQEVRTVRVRWIEEPLELVLDSDVPRIPDQFHYGLGYLGIAKYFEFQKEQIASYYRQLHEQFKDKVLRGEWGDTDEMPAFQPDYGPQRGTVVGKIGRVYNR